MEITLTFTSDNLNKYFIVIENLDNNNIPYSEREEKGLTLVTTENTSYLRGLLILADYYES